MTPTPNESNTSTNPEFSLFNPWYFIASGAGSGLSPIAPGTLGTLAAVPLVLLLPDTLYWQLAVITAVAVIGWLSCNKVIRHYGCGDHGSIVIDEISGYLIAMLAVVPSWESLTLAFFLFRFLDIVKPWPINWLDRQLGGGLGIMADDWMAGAVTCLLVHWLVVLDML